jgi:hypothetical protein
MSRISIAVLFVSLSLFVSLPGVAQTPEAADGEKLLALVKEVETQQAQIADNQAKIEAKLADVSEAIRVARIFSKREK